MGFILNFSKVQVETKEPYLVVKHKLFKVPCADYEGTLRSYLDPYKEEAVQEYVSNYLAWAEDPGIVGLVGVEKKGEHVIIDAAVRYEAKK